MEDKQKFIDGLYQLWANAGKDDWIVEEHDDLGFTEWVVFGLLPEIDGVAPKREIAVAYSEEIADYIATTHAVIPELTELFMSALDESDRLDEEKDDLHGQIFNLELERASLGTEVGDLLSKISNLETELEDRDYTVARIVEENESYEYENNELRQLTIAQGEEIGELRNVAYAANERIDQLELDLWLANS